MPTNIVKTDDKETKIKLVVRMHSCLKLDYRFSQTFHSIRKFQSMTLIENYLYSEYSSTSNL
jgi:hypothetical protein